MSLFIFFFNVTMFHCVTGLPSVATRCPLTVHSASLMNPPGQDSHGQACVCVSFALSFTVLADRLKSVYLRGYLRPGPAAAHFSQDNLMIFSEIFNWCSLLLFSFHFLSSALAALFCHFFPMHQNQLFLLKRVLNICSFFPNRFCGWNSKKWR